MFTALTENLASLHGFLDAGGPVLWLIAVLGVGMRPARAGPTCSMH